MRRFQKVILIIMLLVIAGFILTFILENNHEITLNILTLTTPSLPISILIIIAFLLGLIIALIISYTVIIKMRIKLSLLKKQLTATKKELSAKGTTLLTKNN